MPRPGVLEAVERSAAADDSGWSGAARSAELVELLEARERLDALILRKVGKWDRDKCWAEDHALSAASWLCHRVPVTKTDAMVLVRTARHVVQHGTTAKALDAGDISSAHAQVMARAVRHREKFYPESEDVILDAARALRPDDFKAAMQHWRACADAVADTKDALDDLEGNYLDVTRTFRSVGHLEGRLDPISTAALLDKLDKLEPPDPPDAPVRRTIAQRRAAALIRLVYGEKPPEVGIDVLVDVDTLAGRPSPDLTFGCCEIQGFGTVSPALVRALACDAAIGRVLMRGKSEVLDLGRRTRMITPAQRRALQIRDRTCSEEGCDLPGVYCDGHHIIHWLQHGPTDLVNLEFRCRRHHVLQHLRDLEDAMATRRE
jgi:Domain of unknown function (DUF222)